MKFIKKVNKIRMNKIAYHYQNNMNQKKTSYINKNNQAHYHKKVNNIDHHTADH